MAENVSPGAVSPGAPILDIQDVYKSFGNTKVLRGVSFSVSAGEVCCLLGPSGSGKTTLLRCINHLETIDSGRIYLDGSLVGYTEESPGRLRQAHGRALARARSQIGFVFQSFNLFSHRTALENVMEGPVRVQGRPAEEVREEARAVLQRVGMGHKEDSHPSQLSGGQQQRIGIARALAMKPRLILFDEPTSALDPELVGEVLAVMRDLATDGMTMVIVSHEIQFAREVADHAVIMDDGVVVESGHPSTVLENPSEERTRKFLARFLQQ